jgi:hypothetical protein
MLLSGLLEYLGTICLTLTLLAALRSSLRTAQADAHPDSCVCGGCRAEKYARHHHRKPTRRSLSS